MQIILCGATAARNAVFCLLFIFILFFFYITVCVCARTSGCELVCVTNSAPKHFTVPEGHIYVALSQFTSSPPV